MNSHPIMNEIDSIAAQRWQELETSHRARIADRMQKMRRSRDRWRTAAHLAAIALVFLGIAWFSYHRRLSRREAGLLMVWMVWVDLWWQNTGTGGNKGQ